MNRIITKLLVLALPLALLSSLVSADVSVGVVFSKGEISIIAQWYQDQSVVSGSGNGKNKSKGLPPGIAKNISRGKSLPPGIARQVLPHELVAMLPPPRHGFERIIVDGKVLLVEVATRVIHDILADSILR